MGKHSIGLIGAVLVVASACGGRQGPGTSTPHREPGQTAYACTSGPIMLKGVGRTAVLVDDTFDRIIDNAWSDDDGQHFLSFERIGEDRRQVAIEYLVPNSHSRSATMRIYDRAAGSHFKITAHPRSWRIHGEPSSETTCSVNGPSIAFGAGQ